MLHDQKREKWDDGTYVPLRHMGEGMGEFLVIDSILNEEAVMAFEYGFACSAPDKLDHLGSSLVTSPTARK